MSNKSRRQSNQIESRWCFPENTFYLRVLADDAGKHDQQLRVLICDDCNAYHLVPVD